MRIINIFIICLMCCSCAFKKNESSIHFEIDSLSIYLNNYINFNNEHKSEIKNAHENKLLQIIIGCNVTNMSDSTRCIYTSRRRSSINIINKILHIKNKTFRIITPQHEPPFYTKVDTFYPSESKKYIIPFYGLLQPESGKYVYANVILLEYKRIERNNDEIPNGSEFEETPISYLLSININKNEVRLVDSTFEEVFESYKRRGYIVQ